MIGSLFLALPALSKDPEDKTDVRLTALETAITDLQFEVATQDVEISTLQADLFAALARIVASEADVSTLQDNMLAAESVISVLQTNLDTNTAGINNFQNILAGVSRFTDGFGYDTLQFRDMNLQIVNGWETTDLTDGDWHYVVAVRDAAGNSALTTINVTVADLTSPVADGSRSASELDGLRTSTPHMTFPSPLGGKGSTVSRSSLEMLWN